MSRFHVPRSAWSYIKEFGEGYKGTPDMKEEQPIYQINRPDGEFVFKIMPKGNIVVNEKSNNYEAAKEFWDTIRAYFNGNSFEARNIDCRSALITLMYELATANKDGSIKLNDRIIKMMEDFKIRCFY